MRMCRPSAVVWYNARRCQWLVGTSDWLSSPVDSLASNKSVRWTVGERVMISASSMKPDQAQPQAAVVNRTRFGMKKSYSIEVRIT